eukprot:gene28309-15542_t
MPEDVGQTGTADTETRPATAAGVESDAADDTDAGGDDMGDGTTGDGAAA